MGPEDVDRMAKSVHSDQTAPTVYNVCPRLSVQILRIIRVGTKSYKRYSVSPFQQ